MSERSTQGKNNTNPSATVPVFGFTKLHDAVCLAFPNGLRDWSKLNLKSVRYVPVDEDSAQNVETRAPVNAVDFWQFARGQLKHYRGASKKKTSCFFA